MDFLNRTDIVKRLDGWTPSMVKKFLGEPDKLKKVSGFKHPFCLYSVEKIKQAEQLEQVRALLQKNLNRRQKIKPIKKRHRI